MLNVSGIGKTKIWKVKSGKREPLAHPALRPIDQYAAIRQFYRRLTVSRRCYTEDPEQAELFFIPIFVSSLVHERALIQAVKERCVGKADELVRALKYLTWETAHKHVIGIGRMSTWWFTETCLAGHDVGGQNGVTKSEALLRAVPLLGQERIWPEGMRYEFEEVHLNRGTDENLDVLSKNWCCTGVRCNNVHPLPYNPSFTWNVELQQLAAKSASVVNQTWVPSNHVRDIFLLYFASLTAHGDVQVRERIHQLCKFAKNFTVPGFSSALTCRFSWTQESALLKLRARYCLEAVGDTVGRKSITDDYASGCIPVFVGAAMLVPYPEFWRGWHDAAFIIISRSHVLERTYDKSGHLSLLLAELQGVEDTLRARIEHNMAKYGQRFMWFEDLVSNRSTRGKPV
eukprot:455423-Amphidinium_carterae.1